MSWVVSVLFLSDNSRIYTQKHSNQHFRSGPWCGCCLLKTVLDKMRAINHDACLALHANHTFTLILTQCCCPVFFNQQLITLFPLNLWTGENRDSEVTVANNVFEVNIPVQSTAPVNQITLCFWRLVTQVDLSISSSCCQKFPFCLFACLFWWGFCLFFFQFTICCEYLNNRNDITRPFLSARQVCVSEPHRTRMSYTHLK